MNLPKTIDDKLNEGRCYRDIDLASFETRAEGAESEDEKIVRGYATTFGGEYLLYAEDGYEVRESFGPESFAECDLSDVIMQYNHEGRVFARGSNGTLKVAPDEVGLGIVANLGGTDIGCQLYQEIRGGYTKKMSIGFRVGGQERVVEEDLERNLIIVHRKITRVSKLYDVSAVSLPANDATSISVRNFGKGVIAEVMQERQRTEALRARIRILGMR